MTTPTPPAADPSPPSAPTDGERVVSAIYDGEVIRPLEPLELPPGTAIRLVVPAAVTITATPVPASAPVQGLPSTPAPAVPAPSEASPGPSQSTPGLTPVAETLKTLFRPQPSALRPDYSALTRPELLLLVAGLLFYGATRLVGLTAFPIYFFCDEAIQTTLARALLANGLRDANGVFLPPYFLNAEKWNLSFSIYVHTLSVALFGHSLFLTRATSVAVSLLGVAAVTLSLRLSFNSRAWWVAPFALAAMPAWFLHSRTAFETVMMVSFYACFLCCYLLYRTRGPAWLLPALVFGAMTFYSYANGQGVMLASGLLLLILDLRYHLQQGWRVWAIGAATLAVLVVPLLRFRMLQPDAYTDQLRHLDSYWLRDLPLTEKLARFAENYGLGLSPGYWFFYNTVDLERHRMLGMGHLGLWLAPLIAVGLFVCLRNWRSPAHRVVLVAILAAPFSAALVASSITRVLAIVVPAAILAALGVEQSAAWLRRWIQPHVTTTTAAVALGLASLLITRAALVDGPTWYGDYGMNGMQWGANQLFGERLPAQLAADPVSDVIVSPTWANNPDVFLEFFLTPAQRQRVRFGNIDAFLFSRRDLDPARQLFVMPEYEYQRALASGKFVVSPPEQIVNYPDGRPGFYFVRLAYVPNVDELFAADREARARLIEATAVLEGVTVPVQHSALDIGTIQNLFDDDPNSLMRGAEANPLVVELRFPQPRNLSGVTLTVGSMNFDLKLSAVPVGGGAPVEVTSNFSDLPPDPTVQLDLPGAPLAAEVLRLEIRQLDAAEVAHIHVRELALR